MSLRVLHCIYDDPGNPWVAGGGAVRVHELYRRLAERVDVTVATGNYPQARDEVIDGVRYLRLGAERPYAWSRLTYARAANRLLRSAPYDCAVFDFSTYTPIFVPRDRPVGITVHHISAPTAHERWGRPLGSLVGHLESAMIRRGRQFSATSRATLDQLRPIVGADAEIDLVYAGVPDELFELERHPRDFVLYFGRLDIFQKGLDVLLQAFALLVNHFPALRLRIAGRGKDADAVAQLARQLGVAPNVEIVGAVSDEHRRELLSEAVIQVMPSRFEGFGMTAAEAMAAGVPLVASEAGSLPEVVSPPDGGRLVAVGDAGALAKAIEELLRNPAERQRLSRSARGSADRFRWDTVAEQHLRFLHHIAAGRSSSPERT